LETRNGSRIGMPAPGHDGEYVGAASKRAVDGLKRGEHRDWKDPMSTADAAYLADYLCTLVSTKVDALLIDRLANLCTMITTRVDSIVVDRLCELRVQLESKMARQEFPGQGRFQFSAVRETDADYGLKCGYTKPNGCSSEVGMMNHELPDEETMVKMQSTVTKRFTQVDDSHRSRALEQAAVVNKSRTGSKNSERSDQDQQWCSEQRDMLRRIMGTRRFEYVLAAAIISNALLIGLQVQYSADKLTSDPDPAMSGLSYVYTVGFTVELGARLLAIGCTEFFMSADKYWNVIDLALVTFSLIEIPIDALMQTKGSRTNLSAFRLIRILRIARIMRVVRVMRFFRPLRVLLLAIAGALKSAVWTLSLLLLVLFTFAILFTQGAVDYLIGLEIDIDEFTFNDDEVTVNPLRWHWGTLPRSVFTLFKAISGGMDWGDAARPLSDLSPFYVAVFVFFIGFVQIAVMNVVTGIFVNSAMESAQHDCDSIVADQLATRHTYVKQLQKILGLMDTNGCSNITLTDLEDHLQSEGVQAFFQALDIDASDAWTLFKLLDSAGRGYVDAEEFVTGCMRMRGVAKNIQLANLQYENKIIGDRITDLTQSVNDEFGKARRHGCKVEQQLDQLSQQENGLRPKNTPNTAPSTSSGGLPATGCWSGPWVDGAVNVSKLTCSLFLGKDRMLCSVPEATAQRGKA